MSAPDQTNVTIFLLNDDDLRQFRVFCDDCIQEIEMRAQANAQSVLVVLNDTLARWVELLRVKKKGLTLQKKLGIIGELLVLRDLLIKEFAPSDCIKAWNGPNGHEQDFLLNGKLIEVKCQLSSRDKIVKIASLEQLDCISGQIYLAHIGVSSAEREMAGSFSIGSIVDQIIDLLNGDNYSIDCFLGKLELIGYHHSESDYSDFYVKSYSQIYRIDDDFPCLVRGKTPPAIENCRYKLNLASLAQWEISESAVLLEVSECQT